jgi:biopolymer transport protein ExbB
VFAFNWRESRNRKIAAMLSTFSTDLLAYMNSNGAVKPAVVAAAPAAKPAAKPAANPTLNKS